MESKPSLGIVDVVWPGLGGETGGRHRGQPVLLLQPGHPGLHQQPPPALAQLKVETVGVRLACSNNLSSAQTT